MQGRSVLALGVSGSLMAQRYDLKQLLTYIQCNDKRSFRLGIQASNRDDLNVILVETILKKKKEYFEIILDRLAVIRKLEPPNYEDADYYDHCFVAVVHCNDPYFIFRILEIHGNVAPSDKRTLLHIAVHFQSPTIAHHLILKGADVNALDIVGTTPLEEAILKKNLELVCMLLYYGAHINYSRNRVSDFMYCLRYETSEEIQKTLIDYETNFNSSYEGMSSLFLAIKAKSPLILEIIERGADINYHSYEHNAIAISLSNACDPEIFRMLWKIFDYKIWQKSYSKSVIMIFLFQRGMPLPIWKEYLKIFMENESKLRLDLEHHRNSYFFTSDLLICNFYLSCLRSGIGEDTSEAYVMHLLSHGAQIFTKDIDVIYNELRECTPFLKSLLYMDLYCTDDYYTSFMYFKYSLTPDVNTFMTNIALYPEILLHAIIKLKVFCAFTNDLQHEVLDIVGTEDPCYERCKQMLKSSANFPSLSELSRAATRKVICLENDIKSGCMLHTFIRYSTLPLCIQDVLLFELPIYFFDVKHTYHSLS